MKRWESGALGFLLLFFVAFFAAAGGGYWLVSTGKIHVKLPEFSLPTLFEKPRATEQDFTFIEDETLRKHFVAQANVRRYRTKTGVDFSQVKEGILADKEIRFYAKETLGDTGAELIRVGSMVYVFDSTDSTWWKQIINPEDTVLSLESEQYVPRDFKTEYQGKSGLTFTAAGEEACGTMTCYKYEEGNAESALAKRTFWFDKNKRLLRKEEVSFAGLSSTTEYEYDAISIKEPDKAKDVPEGAYIFAYFTGTPPAVAEDSLLDSNAILGDQINKRIQEQLDKQLQERLQKQLDEQLQKQLEERLQQQILGNPLPAPDVPILTP